MGAAGTRLARGWKALVLRRLARSWSRVCPRCGRTVFARVFESASSPDWDCPKCAARGRLSRAFIGLITRLMPNSHACPNESPQVEALTRLAKRRMGEIIIETINKCGLGVPMVMVRPLHVYWFITSRCDGDCPHCVVKEVREKVAEPSTDELMRVADRLIEAGVPWVTLTGGEPLLRGDLVEIVTRLSAAGVPAYVITSGRAVTGEILRRLAEVRLARMLVSVDGRPAIHDRFRGAGSHRAAVAALELLRGSGIRYGLSVTMHGGNVEELEYLRDLARDTGCSQLYVGEYIPNCPGPEQPMPSLRAADRRKLYAGALRLKTEDAFSSWGGQYAFDMMSPLMTAWTAEECSAQAARGTRGKSGIMSMGCGAGTAHLSVMPDGEVHPCYAWRHRLGNLLEQPLVDIWRSAALATIRKEYATRCGGCRYVFSCGGCPGRRERLGQDLTKPDPDCPVAAGERVG